MGRLLTFLLLSICSIAAAPKIWYWDTAVIGTSANNGTSWANAFTNVTFSYVSNQFGAGDTNYFSGGTTSNIYYGQFNVTGGTPGAPSYYLVGQDAGHNGIVVFDNKGTNNNCFWLGGGGDDNLVISGEVNGHTNMIWKDSTAPTTTTGLTGAGNTNVTLAFIACHDLGNGLTMADIYNVTVTNCSFERIRADHAVLAVASYYDIFDQITIKNCYVLCYALNSAGNGPDGFTLGQGVTVDNVIFESRIGSTTGAQHPDAIQGTGSNWKIRNSTFHPFANSCSELNPLGVGNTTVSNYHDVYYYNNVFRKDYTNFLNAVMIEMGENSRMVSMSNIWFLNNTCIDWANSLGFGWDNHFQEGNKTTAYFIVNNVPNGNTNSLTLGGSTRTFTNDVTGSPSTLIHQTNTISLTATQIYTQLTNYPVSGTHTISVSDEIPFICACYNVSVRGSEMESVVASMVGNWGVVSYGYTYSNAPTVVNWKMLNNIFYNCGSSPTLGWAIGIGNHTNVNCQWSDIDCSCNVITAGSAGSTQILFQTGTSIDTNRYYVQQTSRPRYGYTPSFVSYTAYSTNSDFRLLSTDTAATGYGTNLTSLGLFTNDLNGMARPSSGAWTIGAYETSASTIIGSQLNVSGTARVGTMRFPQLLLAEVSTVAQGAYSVARRLTNSWTSALALVVRSTDSATNYLVAQDSTNNIDAIVSWAGAGSVFVTNLFDQSGHGRTLTGTNTLTLPCIVTNGVMVANGGKSAMVFDISDGKFDNLVAAVTLPLPITELLVVYPRDNNGPPIITGSLTGSTNCTISGSSTWQLANGTNVHVGTKTIGQWDVVRAVFNGVSTFAVDSAVTQTATAGTNTLTAFSIGSAHEDVVGTANMLFSEWVVFGAALSDADQVMLRDNINAFYAAY